MVLVRDFRHVLWYELIGSDMILEKLKQIFGRTSLPEETRNVFSSARSVKQLLTSLDEILRQNNLERAKVIREIDDLEKAVALEEKKIAEGTLSGRAERNVLSRIKQLNMRLSNLDRRVRIFDRNIELHNNLIARIQDVQAMQLTGVDEKQIENIILEWDERFDEFMREGEAARALAAEHALLEDSEEKELAALKDKILADYGAVSRRKKAREKKTIPHVELVEKPPPVTREVSDEPSERQLVEE